MKNISKEKVLGLLLPPHTPKQRCIAAYKNQASFTGLALPSIPKIPDRWTVSTLVNVGKPEVMAPIGLLEITPGLPVIQDLAHCS
jgi:hypothetical protein